jgi:hypothetical protein
MRLLIKQGFEVNIKRGGISFSLKIFDLFFDFTLNFAAFEAKLTNPVP